MSDEVLIRASRDADIAAIAAIYSANVLEATASYEYDPPGVEEMARRRAAILACGFPYFVAEAEGAVVGYAYVSSYRDRTGYRFTVEDSVYVAERAAGRGIGKQLIQALMEACEKLGFRQMIAVVGDRANIASIRLHESCGFRVIGIFPSIGFKFGRWVDSVQMQRALGSGDGTLPEN